MVDVGYVFQGAVDLIKKFFEFQFMFNGVVLTTRDVILWSILSTLVLVFVFKGE